MSNRSLIVLSLSLLLTSLTFAQDLSKPVTYRTVAIPLRQALEQISLQAGVKLTVSDELGDEPIILCLRGVITQDTMDHIATAIGAKWTDKGKGEYLLERTPAMAEKLLANLQSGTKLSAGEMSQQQWGLFQKVAYQGNGQVYIDGPGMDGGEGEAMSLGTYVLAREPTEIMPNGLPPDATISLTSKNADLVFADTKFDDGWEWVDALSIDQIAHVLSAPKGTEASKSSILWLGPGVSRDLTMTFALTPTRKRIAEMHEVVRGDEEWTLDNLPPDLKKKLDAAMVRAKAEWDKTPDTPQPVAQPPHEK